MRKPKAVSCEEFSRFTTEEKAAMIHREGIYIGKLNKSGFIVLLYQIEDFYIEIYYIEFRAEVDHFICTKDINILDEYFNAET